MDAPAFPNHEIILRTEGNTVSAKISELQLTGQGKDVEEALNNVAQQALAQLPDAQGVTLKIVDVGPDVLPTQPRGVYQRE